MNMFKSQRKQKAQDLADRLCKMARISDVQAMNPLVSDKEKAAYIAKSETLILCSQLIKKEIV
jgi:hypothetical protein